MALFSIHTPGHNARSQAEQLCDLILQKLGDDDKDSREKFVQSRFQQRMASHLTRAPWLGNAHTAIGVIAISGGVAASTLAASGNAHSAIVVVLGLVVAAVTAMNQIFKFAKRSVVRFRAGNELRHEAWDFILGKGRYMDKSPEDAFGAFYAEIWRIEAPVDASVELEQDQASHA